MKPTIRMTLPVAFIKHNKSVVAYSPVLDLSTVGKTQASAKKMFEEAVTLFFDEVMEMGNLEDVLTDLGWKKVNKSWNPPKVSTTPMNFKIPTLV